ncbi:DUF6542 domain-containing protein [Streptomyces sp. NPDC049577]|uniref:DUF6542 domain-containing protein n=1 Tax=Streptomyces sp. NPDC049577 TaxID=3155153 RepID=UPI0034497014
MEQPSTRIPQRKVRRGSPVPRPAAPVGQGGRGGRGSPAADRTRPRRTAVTAGRLPPPRLTGLGSGLLTTLAMLAAGGLVSLLLHGSAPAYGMLFVLASAACAFSVRPSELMAAPVAAPIAYAVGALPLGDETGGPGAQLMGLVTLLSLNAGWLYSGTLVAGLIALVRRIAHVRARRRRLERERPRPQRRPPSPPPRSPRRSAEPRGRSPR